MAPADTPAADPRDGQPTQATESVPPMHNGLENTTNSVASVEVQEAFNIDGEQQEQVEHDTTGSLTARLRELDVTAGTARYPAYKPPWCPNQQLPDNRYNSYVSQDRLDWSSMPPPPPYGRYPQQVARPEEEPRYQGRISRETTKMLREWVVEHLEHPYPTEEEKEDLAKRTGLNPNQVANWLINARRRYWPDLKRRRMAKEEGKRAAKVAERDGGLAGGGEDGEITLLEEAGDGVVRLNEPAQGPKGTEVIEDGDEDWELVSLTAEGEQEPADHEAVAHQTRAKGAGS